MPTTIEQDYFSDAYEQYCEVVQTLSTEASQTWEHGEVERTINRLGTELLRRLFQGHLDCRYASESYQSDVQGQGYFILKRDFSNSSPCPALR